MFILSDPSHVQESHELLVFRCCVLFALKSTMFNKFSVLAYPMIIVTVDSSTWGWAENLCSQTLQELVWSRANANLVFRPPGTGPCMGLARGHMLMGQAHEHICPWARPMSICPWARPVSICSGGRPRRLENQIGVGA